MYEVDICVFNGEEQPTVTSLDVAESFKKRHDSVLRQIKRMACSSDFRLHHFAESSYTNEQGKIQPMYTMDRDGFALLAMGFTGRKAMQFKEKYIAAFNRMERELRRRQTKEAKALAARQAGIMARRTLTDEIRDSGENDRMHGHAYSTYTNLVHKSAVGESLKDTRKRLGLGKKDSVRDSLSGSELESLTAVEKLTASLIACGFQYEQVKQILAARANLPAKGGGTE